MRRATAKFVLSALLTMSHGAFAQEWIESRRTGDGPGINLGNNVIFHTGLGVEGGYNTNVLRRSPDLTNADVEDAGRLRVSAYFDLATHKKEDRVQDEAVFDATPPKVEFSLGLGTYYDAYFSDDIQAKNQNNLGIDLHFDLVLLPDRPFSFIADAIYLRTIEPYESTYDQWESHRIKPGVGLRIRPGGGTLMFELGYRPDLTLYEDDTIADRNDKFVNEVRFLTSWKFLPKTALIQKTLFSPTIYLGEMNQSSATRVNNDSLPVRALLGIEGLFTEKYGLSLFAGYGGSFYKAGDDFDSVIANLVFRFYITPTSNLVLGGERDFVDSYYGNFYVNNGGYLKFEQMIANIVLVTARGDLFYRMYSEYDIDNDNLDSGETRSDLWIGATLFVEARVTNWLSLNLTCRYEGNISDYAFRYTDTNTGQTEDYPVDFNMVELMGGARVYY